MTVMLRHSLKLSALALTLALAACSTPPPPPPPAPPAPPPPPSVSLSPRLIEQAAAYADYVVKAQAISPGFTDSNLARPKGTKAYGLVPFEIDAELLGTMHGKHERLPISELRRGLEVLFRAVLEVSARP